MNTLLLRLQAPMQSWGTSSHFSVRDSGREPSKSGVIGLVCAALGRERHAELDDLTQLRMGVRVDREGKMCKDYHIAQDVYEAGGGIKKSEPSNRYYLSDAVFLVGLEGDVQLLERIQAALKAPRWCLYLGRKSFPPGKPVWLEDGLRSGEDLLSALKNYPRLTSRGRENMRLVYEHAQGNIICQDVPLSFLERHFTSRRIAIEFIPAPHEELNQEREGAHAAFQT